MGISLLLLIGSGAGLISYYSGYRQEQELHDRLQKVKEEYVTADDSKQNSDKAGKEEADRTEPMQGTPDAAELKKALLSINPDYVGWLDLPDTDISFPVVYRDNEFYLSHDFEGKKNSHGSIFMDETCSEASYVLLLHGHHMKDKTMFAGLSEYKDREYLESHREVIFDTGEGAVPYLVYAAALIDFSEETSLAPSFHYERLPENEEELTLWQNNLKQNAYWYDSGQNLSAEPGRFLVLSTCEYGTSLQRLIVVAVREDVTYGCK